MMSTINSASIERDLPIAPINTPKTTRMKGTGILWDDNEKLALPRSAAKVCTDQIAESQHKKSMMARRIRAEIIEDITKPDNARTTESDGGELYSRR